MHDKKQQTYKKLLMQQLKSEVLNSLLWNKKKKSYAIL